MVGAAVISALLALAAYPMRESLFSTVAAPIAESSVAPVAGLVSNAGLWILIAVVGYLVGWSWLRDRHLFWRLGSAGLGVIGAYLLSEGMKLVAAEPRPCQVMDIEMMLACPETGDWSWPSNHAVLAAAFATACVLAVARTAWIVVPVAVLIGAARVAAGVHYVHDVLAGLAVGIFITTVFVVVLRPILDRFVTRPGAAPRRGADVDRETVSTLDIWWGGWRR